MQKSMNVLDMQTGDVSMCSMCTQGKSDPLRYLRLTWSLEWRHMFTKNGEFLTLNSAMGLCCTLASFGTELASW